MEILKEPKFVRKEEYGDLTIYSYPTKQEVRDVLLKYEEDKIDEYRRVVARLIPETSEGDREEICRMIKRESVGRIKRLGLDDI